MSSSGRLNFAAIPRLCTSPWMYIRSIYLYKRKKLLPQRMMRMQEPGRDYKRFCSFWRVARARVNLTSLLDLRESPWQVHGAREWISQQRDSPIVASQVATIPPCPSLSDKGKPAAVAMAVLYAKKRSFASSGDSRNRTCNVIVRSLATPYLQ